MEYVGYCNIIAKSLNRKNFQYRLIVLPSRLKVWTGKTLTIISLCYHQCWKFKRKKLSVSSHWQCDWKIFCFITISDWLLTSGHKTFIIIVRPFGNLGIGISRQNRHWNRHWHRHCKKTFFAFRIFFEKIKYLCSFLCLVVASVPLCYKYVFLYNFLFIHRKVPIDLLEKGYLNFRKHLPIWCFEKVIAPKFLHTSQQNIQGGILFKCACRPS